jgi:hypothetical protein
MKGISLMGSHRTGKTTLATEYATKHGITFIPMSVSTAYYANGIPMGKVDDFVDRMLIQETALKQYESRLKDQTEPFITDRCFLDLIAYSLADYPENPTEHEATWFLSYAYQCNALNAMYYDKIMLIRPGIPLESCETSWAADFGIVAKVDACMLWAGDQASNDIYILPREVLSPVSRLKSLEVYANAEL